MQPDVFHAAFELGSDGFIVTDDAGRILDVNPRGAGLTGGTREALRGRNVGELLPAGAADGEVRVQPVRLQSGGSQLLAVSAHRLESGGVVWRLRPVAAAGDEVWSHVGAFLDAVPNIAVQGYRADGTVTYWNRASEALYGYTAAEATGRSLLELIVPPELQRRVWAAIERGVKTGATPPAAEFSLQRKDGSRIAVFTSHAILAHPGREPTLFCLGVDFGEHKRLEAARRESENRFRLLADNSTDLISRHSPDGIYLYASPACRGLLGYEPEELVGRSAYEFVHPEDVPAVAKSHAAIVARADTWTVGFRMRRKDGSYLWFETTSKCLLDERTGAVLEIHCASRDITERKRVETALRDSEFFLRKSQEVARLGSYQLEIATGVWVSTPVLDEIFGIAADFPHTVEGWSEVIAPDERARMTDYFVRHVVGGRHRFEQDYRIVRQSDRQERWVRGLGELEFDATGQPVRMVGTIQDITERRRADEALRESEQRFRQMFEHNRAVMLLIDPVGGAIAEANPAAAEFYGYPREALCRMLIDEINLLPPAQVKQERDAAAAARREFFVFPHRLANGEIRTVEVRSSPVDVGGRRLLFSIIQDITARQRAEAGLQMFKFAVDQAVDAAFWMDRDAGFYYVNDQACRSLGYTRDELLRLRLFDVDPDYPREQWVADWQRFHDRQIEAQQLETWHRRKDGTRFPVEISAKHFWFGDTELHVAFARDISERRHADEALRASERKLAEIFRSSPEMIVVTRVADGRVLEINDAGLHMLGFAREEVLGRTTADIKVWPTPADRERVLRMVQEGGQVQNVEAQFRRKDGVLIDVLLSMVPLRLEGQACLITLATDITERTKAEAARLELERRLLHAQKLESLGVLAGGIAHDFNNLLMGILGNLDLALLELSPVAPARTNIQQSIRAARRAADLTRQMLAYSGKGTFAPRRVDLSEMVEENAHLFRSCISRIVTLNLHLARNHPTTTADPGQLQQVVMNLITNASEAIGEQPGVISLSTGVRHFAAAELAGSRAEPVPAAGAFVFVEVVDTGCGMDEVTRQRLFDPFFTTKFTGRGLGMSALLGIVRAHQGAIFVDSAVGRGTTVRVLFPADEKPAPPATDGPAAGPAAVGTGADRPRGTLLVVDDEDAVRDVCVRMLRKFGWTVHAAANGPEAIALFRAAPDQFAGVVLDLSMPGMDGVAVFQALRQIRPGVRVVLTSGYSSAAKAGPSLGEQGFAGFIQKPYDLQDMQQALARALQG